MTVRYSYSNAARRLVRDSWTLWEHRSPETATHLAGLSAECALKSILAGLGVLTLGPDGQLDDWKNWGVHIREDKARKTQLWSEFHAALSGHAGRAFVALVPPATPAPFDGWRVSHRYVADRQLQPEDMEQWMWAAIAIGKGHEQAILEGVA